jgi:CheY-like chemotaxis protein
MVRSTSGIFRVSHARRRAPAVLCVDPDDDVRFGLAEALRSEGYEVTTAASGSDALSALTLGGPFDVVLCAYELPYGTGTQLLRLAQERRVVRPGTVLVLCADQAVVGDEDMLVLRRPVEIDDLASYLWARLGAATFFGARSG